MYSFMQTKKESMDHQLQRKERKQVGNEYHWQAMATMCI